MVLEVGGVKGGTAGGKSIDGALHHVVILNHDDRTVKRKFSWGIVSVGEAVHVESTIADLIGEGVTNGVVGVEFVVGQHQEPAKDGIVK